MKPYRHFLAAAILLAPVCAPAEAPKPAATNPAMVIVHKARYIGNLTAESAQFDAEYEIEMLGSTGEGRVLLVAGPVALSRSRTSSDSIRTVREGNAVSALVRGKGRYKVNASFMVAVPPTQDVWKTLSFSVGPVIVGELNIAADGEDSKIELVSGTAEQTGHGAGKTSLSGFIGAADVISLRWQARVKEKKIEAVVLCDVHQLVEISPNVIKSASRLNYEVPQGETKSLEALIPESLSVMRVSGQDVRDWAITRTNGMQVCRVELLKPVAGRYTLDILAEQPIKILPATTAIPLVRAGSVARQGGSLAIVPSEVLIDVTRTKELTRMNTAAATALGNWQGHGPDDMYSAFRFSQPDCSCEVSIAAIKPKVTVSHKATVQIQDRRLLVTDTVSLSVQKAGIFSIAMTVPPGLTVTDVKGDGVEDWKVSTADNRRMLNVTFGRKFTGVHTLTISMEQTYDKLPEAISLAGLQAQSVDEETGMIGCVPASGLVVRETQAGGARSVPVANASWSAGATLAFEFRKSDWTISLKTEVLKPRITAQVFNLITIGDGFMGGSATINYTVENAGVREFLLDVPETWRNVDITGVDIRQKSQTGTVWRVTLQDRVLGVYSLVVTYDQPFDPNAAILVPAGLKTVETSQESGHIVVTSGSHLEIAEADGTKGLTRIDARELAARYLALIENPVLRAYSYPQQPCALKLKTTRNTVQKPLDAVADRVRLVTVITKAGRLETQATYLIKNNMKDSLRVRLPASSKLMTALVDNKPAKPETDQDAVVIPLKKPEDRDHAYPVEITYYEEGRTISRYLPGSLQLASPTAAIHSSFVDWEVYLPGWLKARSFRGNMTPAQQSGYSVASEIRRTAEIIDSLWNESKEVLMGIGFAMFLVFGIVWAIVTRRIGVGTVLGVFVVLVLLAALMIPALSKARGSARRSACVNNLRQIDSALNQYALDNGELPQNLDQLRQYGINDYTLVDPESGERFSYNPVAAGKKRGEIGANMPLVQSGRNVLMNDGRYLSSGAAGNISGIGVQTLAPAEPESFAGAAAAGAEEVTGEAAGMVAGLLPIRIQLPTEGKLWQFTKVLSKDDEALTITGRLVPVQTARVIVYLVCIVLIVAALLAFNKAQKTGSLFSSTLGIALVILAAGLLLYVHEMFVVFLLLVPPAVALLLLVGLLRTVSRKAKPRRTPPAPPPPTPPLPIAAGAAGAAIVALLLTAHAAAAQSTNVSLPALHAQVVGANYEGRVAGTVVSFDGELRIQVTVPLTNAGRPVRHYAPCELRFFGGDIALREFKIDGRDCKLMPSVDGFTLRLPKPGEYKASVRFLVTVQGDTARKNISFAAPRSVAAVVRCLIDEKEATVESASAVSLTREFTKDGTVVTVFPGPEARVDLNWIPRVKRAREVEVSAFCRAASFAGIEEGAIRIRSGFKYEVSQGEMLSTRILVPAGLRLLRVSGANVLNWESKQAGDAQELTVDMKSAVTPAHVLQIETELPIGQLPASVALSVPRAIGVQRESATVAVLSGQEISSTITQSANLQRIDPSEFPMALAEALPVKPQGGPLPEHAFRCGETGFQLQLAIDRMKPEIKAVVSQLVTIGEKDTFLAAALQLDIKKAGIFELPVRLPAGYELVTVSGPAVKTWTEETKGQDRILHVIFNEKTRGECGWLNIRLRQRHEVFAARTQVPAVTPLGVQEVNGYVAVGAAFGIAVNKHEEKGLTEVPVSEVPSFGREGAVLAFKFREPGWSLNISAGLSEQWLQADGTHVLWLLENRISVRSAFKFGIQNAPVDRFTITLPPGAENVVITGANIRQRDNDGAKWTITLQGKTRDTYDMAIQYDVKMPAGAKELDLPFARTVGTEREQGFVLVCCEASLHVTERRRSEQALLPVDTRDLAPEVRRQGGDQIRLAYRYLRPTQTLAVAVQRFKAAEVLQAIVEKANLKTVLAEDGQMMTQASLSIRNNAKQHLELQLPENSAVWSCFVAGDAVAVAAKAGKLLLPLVQTGENEPAFDLELTYVTRSAPLKKGRKIAFAAPELDLPAHSIRWDVYVPEGYFYGWFGGTAERLQKVTAEFMQYSWSDYQSSVSETIADRSRKVQVLLSNAAMSAEKGDIVGARGQYQRASKMAYQDASVQRELKNVEEAEAVANATFVNPNNLVNTDQRSGQAQDAQPSQQPAQGGPNDADFNREFQRNIKLQRGQKAAGNQQAVPSQRPVEQQQQEDKYVNAAKEQAKKIRDTQAVTVEKATPLHISPPLRGMHFAFSQALWVPKDKPVTVEMKASRIGQVGIGRTLVVAILGFLFVMVFVGGWIYRSRLALISGTALIALLYLFTIFA